MGGDELARGRQWLALGGEVHGEEEGDVGEGEKARLRAWLASLAC